MKVKVILLETIKGVGKKDQIVEVKDGYANNFLFPQKKGIPATAENLNKLNQKNEKKERDSQKEYEEALELKKKIDGKSISFEVKAGENGKVFGSIGAKEILAEIEKQIGIKLTKKNISGESRVKELGVHNLELKLHKDVTALIKISIKGVE